MLSVAIIRLGIDEGKDKKVMSGCQEVSRKSGRDRKQLGPPLTVSMVSPTWHKLCPSQKAEVKLLVFLLHKC